MSELNLQDAIKKSIKTEKNAMDFYTQGARYMKDQKAKDVFELLAREEREHAEWFFKVYEGDDLGSFDDFITQGQDADNEWLNAKEKSILESASERQAMELAMEKEQALEEKLKEMAERIDDPVVKKVYEDNARSTRNHYLLIEAEYARLMGMVHESDMDTFVRE